MYYLVMVGLLIGAIALLVFLSMRGKSSTTDYSPLPAADDGRTIRCPTCLGSGRVLLAEPQTTKPPPPR